MTRETELKPCPFCGTTPSLEGDGKIQWITCHQDSACSTSGMAFGIASDKLQDGIDAWNRRAALEAKQVEVQMPEPVAYLCPRRSEAVMPDSFLRDASFDALYTEQQVRQLLETQARNLSATLTGARQPLNQDQMRHMSQQHDAEDLCGWSYRMGVQDAEKAHGIKIA